MRLLILKRLSLFFYLLLFILPSLKLWAVAEIGASFSYSKQIYGEQKQNNVVSRTYSASMAVYLFKYTGIELNYSNTTDIVTENNRVLFSNGVYIVGVQSRVNSRIYGVGLRQALAAFRAFIVPVISVGRAREFKTGSTDYTFEYQNTRATITYDTAKTQHDVMFCGLMLKINLTRLFSITGQVKSSFKANEFNEAKSNLHYEAGFSWTL
ncbi:MAG: hypothetical protein HQK53_10740 [Oligoflexia bacterium]|nr:hypothetical protein [Oligoflexia bacterium]